MLVKFIERKQKSVRQNKEILRKLDTYETTDLERVNSTCNCVLGVGISF